MKIFSCVITALLFTKRSLQTSLISDYAVTSLSKKDNEYIPAFVKNFNDIAEIFNSYVYLKRQVSIDKPFDFLKRMAKENQLRHFLDSAYSSATLFDGIGDAFLFFNDVLKNNDDTLFENQKNIIKFQNSLIDEIIFQGEQHGALKKDKYRRAYKMVIFGFLYELDNMIDENDGLNVGYNHLVNEIAAYSANMAQIINNFQNKNTSSENVAQELENCRQCMSKIKKTLNIIIDKQDLMLSRRFNPTYEYCTAYYTLMYTMELLYSLSKRYITFYSNKPRSPGGWLGFFKYKDDRKPKSKIRPKVKDYDDEKELPFGYDKTGETDLKTSKIASHAIGLVMFFMPKSIKIDDYINSKEIRDNLINSIRYNRYSSAICGFFCVAYQIKDVPEKVVELKNISRIKRYSFEPSKVGVKKVDEAVKPKKPEDNVKADEMSKPGVKTLEETLKKVNEVVEKLENVIKKPDSEVSRSESGSSISESGSSISDDEVSRSDDEVNKPGGKVSKPGGKVSKPGGKVSRHGGKVSMSSDETSAVDSEIKSPDEPDKNLVIDKPKDFDSDKTNPVTDEKDLLKPWAVNFKKLMGLLCSIFGFKVDKNLDCLEAQKLVENSIKIINLMIERELEVRFTQINLDEFKKSLTQCCSINEKLRRDSKTLPKLKIFTIAFAIVFGFIVTIFLAGKFYKPTNLP